MRPDTTNDDTQSDSSATERSLRVPAREAAAQVVRDQINALYGDSSSETAQTQQQPHSAAPAQAQQHASASQGDQWKQYHSAWQDYYQKYYEQYYTSHLEQAKAHAPQGQPPAEPTQTSEQASQPPADDIVSLRQNLLQTVEKNAKKVRSSRHFIPIAAACVVVLVFMFLQYNRILIANVQAYISPGAIDPQNIIVDPNAAVEVGPDPRLIIPKINVDVPAIYGVGYDHASQMKAMESGVAHFAIPGANSVPGQVGNTVLSGHSSNDLFDSGDYKFIFAQLDKLNVNDTLYANYEGTRYTYVVTKKEVVLPSQVDKLTYQTDKPILTLITCTPLGTAEKRLLITAEQVAPNPAAANAAPETNSTPGDGAMPGNSPTFVERLFG